MPLYEYECTQCSRRTEKIQKFSDPEITECPYCGGKLERVLHAPAVAFKGGGWYADGYGNAKPSSSKTETKSGSSSSSGSADSGGKESTSAPASAPAAPATPAATSSEKK